MLLLREPPFLRFSVFQCSGGVNVRYFALPWRESALQFANDDECEVQSMKTYTFKVWLPPEKSIFRKIEIRADHTLLTLHRAIQEAFDFDDDHLFSFYMSGRAWDRSTEYSLPENLDMGP